MADRDPMQGEQSAAERAPEQQGEANWPKPGEEGYVHPDGTVQANQQLADNRRAAQDRAAAGSIVHGAPVARNDVLDPGVAAGLAEKRAEDYSGPTDKEREDSVSEFVTEKSQEAAKAAAEQRSKSEGGNQSAEPKKASTDAGKQTR